jgi:hypothetical protein
VIPADILSADTLLVADMLAADIVLVVVIVLAADNLFVSSRHHVTC